MKVRTRAGRGVARKHETRKAIAELAKLWTDGPAYLEQTPHVIVQQATIEIQSLMAMVKELEEMGEEMATELEQLGTAAEATATELGRLNAIAAEMVEEIEEIPLAESMSTI